MDSQKYVKKCILAVKDCAIDIVTIRQRKSTNIIMHTKKEAEVQLLDDQFKMRIREATSNITSMQQNETNGVNNNNSNSNEMDHHSSTPRGGNTGLSGGRGKIWNGIANSYLAQLN